MNTFLPITDGQSDVEVELIAKKYVERGSSVTLYCKHNVEPEKLYKVTWLKGIGKVFEYITGRDPPYRNYTVPGAEIDFQRSNQNEVTLKNIDFDAAGMYYCEVSLESPIFTKASNEAQIHVIREYRHLISLSVVRLPFFFFTACPSTPLITIISFHFLCSHISVSQNGPPSIVFKKRQFYVGEKLIANCTTTRSKPVPHITWLINGKKVNIWQLFIWWNCCYSEPKLKALLSWDTVN